MRKRPTVKQVRELERRIAELERMVACISEAETAAIGSANYANYAAVAFRNGLMVLRADLAKSWTRPGPAARRILAKLDQALSHEFSATIYAK